MSCTNLHQLFGARPMTTLELVPLRPRGSRHQRGHARSLDAADGRVIRPGVALASAGTNFALWGGKEKAKIGVLFWR
jgi:hypothetical protein